MDESGFDLTIHYRIPGVPKPPLFVHSLTNLLDAVADSGLEFHCRASVTFLYPGGMDRSSIVLPIGLFRTSRSAGFDTIEGIEVARTLDGTENRQVMYISVDPTNRDLFHLATLISTQTVAKNIESGILKQAKALSQRFLEPA